MKTVILLCTLAMFNQPMDSSRSTVDMVVDCYTQEGYIAAISEKYLDDVVRYSVDKDYIAIEKLLKKGVIVQMKKGIKVHLVNTHLFSGKVEFRLPGQTDVLWTVSEGIKC
jgi:hypothetical protein